MCAQAVALAAPHQKEPVQNAVAAWADIVLGGLEDHPPYRHCLMSPCITVSEVTRIQVSCAPDIQSFPSATKTIRSFGKV